MKKSMRQILSQLNGTKKTEELRHLDVLHWRLAAAIADFVEECYVPTYNCRRAPRQWMLVNDNDDMWAGGSERDISPTFENVVRMIEDGPF